jgi:hypothetical protein
MIGLLLMCLPADGTIGLLWQNDFAHFVVSL